MCMVRVLDFGSSGQHLSSACDALASLPGGSRNTPSCFVLQKPEIVVSLMVRLVLMQTLPFLSCHELLQEWAEMKCVIE